VLVGLFIVLVGQVATHTHTHTNTNTNTHTHSLPLSPSLSLSLSHTQVRQVGDGLWGETGWFCETGS